MDILTHVCLPLTAVYGTQKNDIPDRKLFLLSFFAILPDADIFLGIHRGLLHSVFFILPLLTFLYFLLPRKYFKYAAFFLVSHLALDFIGGPVPFFYPLVNKGVGIEFPFAIKLGPSWSSLSIVEYLPRLVFGYPNEVYGQIITVFSSFGIASVLLFLAIYRKRQKASPLSPRG